MTLYFALVVALLGAGLAAGTVGRSVTVFEREWMGNADEEQREVLCEGECTAPDKAFSTQPFLQKKAFNPL